MLGLNNLKKNFKIGGQVQEGKNSFKVVSKADFIATTPDGKIAADNLLTAINRSKEKISEELKAKQEKIDTMLNLLENDPEIKKRYNELMTGKEVQ